MNNTINQPRMTNSRPSFKGFSQKAQRYITEESIGKLVESGKIKLSDFEYIKNHKLEIDVLSSDPQRRIRAAGLHIKPPYARNVGEPQEANYYESPIDIKLTPTKDEFSKTTFANIDETLGSALRNAIKFFKRFDKIELEKANYYIENGEAIDSLLKARKEANDDYKALLKDIFRNEKSATRYAQNNDGFEPVAKLDKELARFHNDEYFENKQKKLFSVWNINNIIGN